MYIYFSLILLCVYTNHNKTGCLLSCLCAICLFLPFYIPYPATPYVCLHVCLGEELDLSGDSGEGLPGRPTSSGRVGFGLYHSMYT